MGAQLAVGAASLLINALAARAMGPTGRGNLALLLQVTYVCNIVALAGTDRAYPASVSPGRSPITATTDALRLILPSTVVVLAVSLPFVFMIGAGTSSGGGLTLLAFLVAALAMMAGAAVRTGAAASGVAGPFVMGTVAGQLVLIMAVTMLTTLGNRSPALWLLIYGAALSTAPVVAWVLLRRRRAGGSDPTHNLRQVRRLGFRLLPAGLASVVMLRADRLLLPWLGSYEQLGLYIVVATLAEFVTWPVQSYVDAQASRWHRRFLAGELRLVRPLLGAAAYGLATAVGLLVAGHLAMVPVFGPEYRQSLELLPPLAIGTLFYSVSRIAVGLAVATGRARSALVADIPAMVIALAGYLLLIPGHGAFGAAVASAVAYGVGALLAVMSSATLPCPSAPPATVGVARRRLTGAADDQLAPPALPD
ncbi:lipopolysaccharide biosynthesis protein [Micromonospora sp. LZ34]